MSDSIEEQVSMMRQELRRLDRDYDRLQEAVREFVTWFDAAEDPDTLDWLRDLPARVHDLRHAANLCSKPAP